MLDPDGSPEWQSIIHHFYPHLLRVNLVLKVILKRFTWNANFQWHERKHEVSTLGGALFRRTQMSTTRPWRYYVSDEYSLENWLEVLERRIWCLHLDVRSICWSASPSNEKWTHILWSDQDCTSTYGRYPKECSRHCKEDDTVELKAKVFIVESLWFKWWNHL